MSGTTVIDGSLEVPVAWALGLSTYCIGDTYVRSQDCLSDLHRINVYVYARFLIFTHRHLYIYIYKYIYIYIKLPAAPETLWIITPLFTMIPPSDCRTS